MSSNNRREKGFTLIELVVVIAILAILAAFALPRFAQLSEQAHQSSIQGTAGALAAGVALSHAQWVTNGHTGAIQDLQGFGNETVNMSANGWPVSAGTQTYTGPASGSVTMNPNRCVNVWQALLQANAPEVANAAGADVEYVASAAGGVCTYTYQPDQQNSTIAYDAVTGELTRTVN